MASAIEQGLFKGAVVIIDDQVIGKEDPRIVEIENTIRSAGGHPILLGGLPDADFDAENYRSVAFVIMDWQLGHEPGVTMPDDVRDGLYNDNVEFIRKLSKHRHAPVVIFTNEAPHEVERFLNKHDDMAAQLKSSRLLLKSKADVGTKVYDIVNDWASKLPSVLSLKTWERESLRAVNELFIDFQDKSPLWPVMLWETYKADGLSPAEDLGRLITRLVASRIDNLKLDLDPFLPDIEAAQKSEADYSATLRRVLEGERTLEKKRLHNVAPGDIFSGSKPTELYVNIRPDCDVVLRQDGDDPELYLLRGKGVKDSECGIQKHGQIVDRDSEFTVFAMFEGRNFKFNFKDLTIGRWSALQGRRVGRLLPPFSTRLQQRYTAYLQRTGLPTIPKLLRPAEKAAVSEAASATDAALAQPASPRPNPKIPTIPN